MTEPTTNPTTAAEPESPVAAFNLKADAIGALRLALVGRNMQPDMFGACRALIDHLRVNQLGQVLFELERQAQNLHGAAMVHKIKPGDVRDLAELVEVVGRLVGVELEVRMSS